MPVFKRHKSRSDAELVKQIALNDVKAFDALIVRYETPLFSFCLGILQDKTEAEDMVQETFLKLYQSIGFLDTQKNVKSYLFKISKHLCIDRIRKKKPDYSDTPPEIVSHETPFDNICRSEAEKNLYQAIDLLGDTEKTAILLKYQSGFTYAEIADVMNKTGPAVESILVRAKKKLRDILATFNQ